MNKLLIAITASENGGSISMKADPSGTPQEGLYRIQLIKAIARSAVETGESVHIVPEDPKVHQTVYLGSSVANEYPDDIQGEKISVQQFLESSNLQDTIKAIGDAFSKDDMSKKLHIKTGEGKTYTLTKQQVGAL